MTLVPLTGALACSTEDGEPAGMGGTAAAGGGGGMADAGMAGGVMAGGAAGSDCPARGSGIIEVQISGLPAGIGADLVVGGPLGARAVPASTRFGEAAGSYVLRPGRVSEPDPIVRTLFDYELPEREFCLKDGGTHRVELAYAPVVTSHRLWTNNANGTGNLFGFLAPSLTASAEVTPSIAALAGAGRDIAFDHEGNLWSIGATVAEPHLMRFPRTSFVTSGEKEPDLRIDVSDVSCLPAMRALAFSRTGSLWVSTCGGVAELAPTDLAASGTVAARRGIEGFEENGDLAFDSARNLWITDAGRVVRFDADRLESIISDEPDAALSMREADDSREIVASNLAFDTAGNLWVIDSGASRVSKIASAELESGGARSVVSQVTIALAAALLDGPAFDESGGLWLALDRNRFGRLAPDQLGTSTGPGAPTAPSTIITSPGAGTAHRMAFFPAAEDLPLYHHFEP